MKKERVFIKKQNSTKLIIASLVFAILVLAIFISISKFSNLTGNAIYSGGYAGTGYADPTGTFTLVQDNFTLTSNNQTVTLQIQVNQQGGYIFKRGYVFNVALNDWVPFEFSEPTVSDSNWINGSLGVSKSLTINATDVLTNGQNYVVTYSCIKVNGNWKCGCENANDTFCNKWMMQVFYVSNANWTQNVSDYCATDSDCNFTFTGNKCNMGKCEFVPQCVNNSDCSTNICSDQRCVECNAASDCSGGKVCKNQYCEYCSLDSDCSVGNVCRNQACVSIVSLLRQNLVAYYPFDTNVQDYSGNGRNPTNNGATPASGKVGGAYLFNGAPYPFRGQANNLNVSFVLQRSNFTVSAWIKPGLLNQNNGFIIYVGNEYPGPGFGYGIGGGDNYGDVLSNKLMGVEASYTWMYGNYTFTSLNNWSYVSMVHRADGVYQYYVDGQLKDQSYSKVASGNFPTSVKIGSGVVPGFYWGRYFNGSIDELSIWNKSLTSQELLQLYNSGNGRSLIVA
jgi:hypothetical protein